MITTSLRILEPSLRMAVWIPSSTWIFSRSFLFVSVSSAKLRFFYELDMNKNKLHHDLVAAYPYLSISLFGPEENSIHLQCVKPSIIIKLLYIRYLLKLILHF